MSIEPLAKAALRYLQVRTALIDARVSGRHDEAEALAEDEETMRRRLADAIIRDDPQLEAQVREVCWYAADEGVSGTIEFVAR